jgi:hypothetical protein
MQHHDTFLSYASHENDFATEVAYGLQANGLSVWFAPISLRVGDKLLESVEEGMSQSRTATLLVSPAYLERGWTSYEMDVLIRQHIEGTKPLLPIWHNVSKPQVEAKHSGLAGIVAITDTSNASKVVSALIGALSEGAPSRAVAPSWENPTHRFLQGLGELNLQSLDGPATSIFEFLLHASNSQYPLWIGGRVFTKPELLLHVAQVLGPVPERVKGWVGEDGYRRLWRMCVQSGLDPNTFY